MNATQKTETTEGRNNINDLVELDENGEPILGPIEEREELESSMDEEMKETAYANNFFAFNEEKLQRDSVAASSEDVRSTDIEDSMNSSQAPRSMS